MPLLRGERFKLVKRGVGKKENKVLGKCQRRGKKRGRTNAPHQTKGSCVLGEKRKGWGRETKDLVERGRWGGKKKKNPLKHKIGNAGEEQRRKRARRTWCESLRPPGRNKKGWGDRALYPNKKRRQKRKGYPGCQEKKKGGLISANTIRTKRKNRRTPQAHMWARRQK